MIEIGSVTTDDQSRRAFGCFPSWVTAVCALVEGAPVGMAASSFTSHAEPATPPLVFHDSRLRRLSAA